VSSLTKGDVYPLQLSRKMVSQIHRIGRGDKTRSASPGAANRKYQEETFLARASVLIITGWTLKIEAACSSETFISTNKASQWYRHNLNNH
jgi:hypothetical protein